jgi:protein arginine kinase
MSKSRKSWMENSNSIWLGSTIRLIRNVSKFKFPGKNSPEHHKQVLSLILNSLEASCSLPKAKTYLTEKMTSLEKEFLFEHFLSTQSFHQAHEGEAFITDDSETFLAIINIKEHVQIQITNSSEDLESSLTKLMAIEEELGAVTKYAFSEKFGYLTADPASCGSGLKAYAFLHLPALIHTQKIQSHISKHVPKSLETTGLQGDPNTLIGDILSLHNKFSLGLTEEDILTITHSTVTKLIGAEKKERQNIKKESPTIIKDKISRAFGLLTHSYQLETIEAMQALSLLKLGLELDWIKGTTILDLNSLLFNCRRAHIQYKNKKDLPNDEIAHVRAEYIRSVLKKISLNLK